MDHAFHTLLDFMIHSKGWTYTLMGLGLVAALGFWRFLTARDEKQRTY